MESPSVHFTTSWLDAAKCALLENKVTDYIDNNLTFPTPADALCDVVAHYKEMPQKIQVRLVKKYYSRNVERLCREEKVGEWVMDDNKITLWNEEYPLLICACPDYQVEIIPRPQSVSARLLFYPTKSRFRIISSPHMLDAANGCGSFIYTATPKFINK